MIYASKKAYAGQRASIGRTVVVNTSNGLGTGTIDSVRSNEELWIIKFSAEDDGRSRWPTAIRARHYHDLEFHPTATPEDIEAMPVGCWTWPVRV